MKPGSGTAQGATQAPASPQAGDAASTNNTSAGTTATASSPTSATITGAQPAPVTTATITPPAPIAVIDGDEPPAQTVDPLRPDRRVIDDHDARQDLWQRIRAGFAIADLDTDLTRSYTRSYAANPEYVKRMTERGARYLFHIVEEVQRRKMPTELALLPFIESAFNPQALSSAKASGIWQFMPQTGRHYDLTQNVFRDERRDVLASTQAALDYLTKLHGMFGDWQLALAAYNWGEGNVQRAIKRNKAAGLPTDYLSLRMPNETRHYVPKLQAIKNIVARPAEYRVTLLPLENHPYFLAVRIDRDIDVAVAARLADLPLDEFRALNPQNDKPVILAAGTPQILLPYDNANAFVKSLAKHKGPLASWTAWTLPARMKSADAAQRAGMSDDNFRLINHIPPRMVLDAGSTVLVPRSAAKQADVSEHLADHARLSMSPEAPPVRKVTVRVGKRAETVAALAQRHKVSAMQVAQWNKVLPQSSFAPGTSVTLHLPVQAKATRVATSAGKARGAASSKATTKSASAKATRSAAAAPPASAAKGAKSSRVAQAKGQERR